MKPSYPKESKVVNKAFDPMSKAIRRFARICKDVGFPIRYISFRVFDNGETKLHVSYKRMKKI